MKMQVGGGACAACMLCVHAVRTCVYLYVRVCISVSECERLCAYVLIVFAGYWVQCYHHVCVCLCVCVCVCVCVWSGPKSFVRRSL